MNKEQFIEEFQETLTYMHQTMVRKNHDYSWGDGCSNPFKNFELVEYIWAASVEQSFIVQICNKVSRISSLMKNEAKVSEEAIEDTLVDLANYAIIMSLYVKSKKEDSV